jgi:outer membrane lipoprotein-sorting protein
MLKHNFSLNGKSTAGLTRLMIVFALCLFCFVQTNQAQTTAFTYQGKLTDSGTAANGQYDFKFKLFDALTGGTQVGADVLSNDVQVTTGVFTVNLDFGAAAFAAGAPRYLEISVRPGISTGAYTPLAPLQPVTSAPFSIKSLNATSADNVTGVVSALNGGTGIGGTYPVAGTFLKSTGTGWAADGITAADIPANITVQAINIAGVVPITSGGTGSSTKNFTDLTTNQTIGGSKTFTSPIIGNGSQLTNLNGANIAPGSVTSPQISPDSLPNSTAYKQLGSLRWDLLRGQKDFAVGTTPRGVAFDGANMWIVNLGSNNVTKIRVSDGANLGAFPVGIFTIGIAFDGANMWISDATGNILTKLRASDGANLGAFPAGNSPVSVAFDGTNIWAVNSLPSGATVTKLRAVDGAILGAFAVGSNPEGIAFDGANMWVVNRSSNNVTKLRASDGTILGTFPAGSSPTGIAFDGANMWVVNLNPSGTATKLRTADGTILGTFTVGANPRNIAFDGTNMWVSNSGSNNVTKLRASDGANLGTFPVGNGAGSLAFDGANMWVVNQSDNNVTRLPPAFP